MQDKEVTIPKALRELHGETARLSTLVLVYLAGLIAAGVVVIHLLPVGLPAWKTLLVAILYLDIASGVVANLSTSTNQYYKDKPKLRTVFALLHVLHPAGFILVLPQAWPYFVFTGLFTLGAIFLMDHFHDTERQHNLAALLVVAGVMLSFFFALPYVFLYSFAPLFLMKLVLGFAVRRPRFYPG